MYLETTNYLPPASARLHRVALNPKLIIPEYMTNPTIKLQNEIGKRPPRFSKPWRSYLVKNSNKKIRPFEADSIF